MTRPPYKRLYEEAQAEANRLRLHNEVMSFRLNRLERLIAGQAEPILAGMVDRNDFQTDEFGYVAVECYFRGQCRITQDADLLPTMLSYRGQPITMRRPE